MFGISMKGAAALVGVVALTSSSAMAVDVLLLDLSVPNQLTVTATGGSSDITASGPDFTGFYLEDFFSIGGAATINVEATVGDLTSANNTSDGSPRLFSLAGDTGLNFFDYTNDASSTFTAGSTAFSGSGTWDLSPAQYADFISGNISGDIFFAADTSDDLPASGVIGQYRVIPTPGTISLAGLACGLVGARRRR